MRRLWVLVFSNMKASISIKHTSGASAKIILIILFLSGTISKRSLLVSYAVALSIFWSRCLATVFSIKIVAFLLAITAILSFSSI